MSLELNIDIETPDGRVLVVTGYNDGVNPDWHFDATSPYRVLQARWSDPDADDETEDDQ